MTRTLLACVTALAVALATPVRAQQADSTAAPPAWTPPPESAAPVAAPQTNPNASNPAISVIGWFQGSFGNDPALPSGAFALREAELGFQAPVDPFARADFFLSAGSEGLDVEEGYLTWLAVPGGGQLKVGKFRTDLGKFNRTHPPETPFADRPLAALAFYGDEGLTTTGVSASALVPNPLGLYWDATVNAGTAPDSTASRVFGPSSRGDVLAVGRSSVFVPVRESVDLNLGLSYANAAANPALRADGSRAQLATGDLTLHWKNPRRAIYRSLVAQAEYTAEQGSRGGAARYTGWFGYAIWQFARQWKLGGRYDWSEAPGDHANESGALALLQWQPSEFSTLSVQARRIRSPGGDSRDAGFLKWTFNIGPHGAHPY